MGHFVEAGALTLSAVVDALDDVALVRVAAPALPGVTSGEVEGARALDLRLLGRGSGLMAGISPPRLFVLEEIWEEVVVLTRPHGVAAGSAANSQTRLLNACSAFPSWRLTRAKTSKALGSPFSDSAGCGTRSDGLQAQLFTGTTSPTKTAALTM